MRELSTNLCSTAFVLECSSGRGSISGSFAEATSVASAFRGELLGLMAIHLVLLAAQLASGGLEGQITIHSDCKGALKQVGWLPPLRIPARCKHADILKVILRARARTSCICKYKHVRAHQDDRLGFYVLTRPAQLNCLMDASAKRSLLDAATQGLPSRRQFPTEPKSIIRISRRYKILGTQASGPHILVHADPKGSSGPPNSAI